MVTVADMRTRFNDLMNKVFSGKLPVERHTYLSMDNEVERAMAKTREGHLDEAIDIYLKICENDNKVYPAVIDFLFDPVLCTSHIAFAYEVIAYAELLAKKCWGPLNSGRQWIQEKRRGALEKYILDCSKEKSGEIIDKLFNLIIELSYSGLSKWALLGFSHFYEVNIIDDFIKICLRLYKVFRANNVICDDQEKNEENLKTFETSNKEESNYSIYSIYYNTKKIKIITSTKKYDKIVFGTYYIENRGKDPIEWDVLEVKDGKALIITHNIIDSLAFDKYNSNNYEKSSIRRWLNYSFYNIAFNDKEKSLIETTFVDNSVSSTGDISNNYVCNNTNDKLFLLSVKETKTYCNNSMRDAKGTDYAKSQGLWFSTCSSYYPGYSSWWLRSPSNNYIGYACNVTYEGRIVDDKRSDSTSVGVRPACWITLED